MEDELQYLSQNVEWIRDRFLTIGRIFCLQLSNLLNNLRGYLGDVKRQERQADNSSISSAHAETACRFTYISEEQRAFTLY